jgi:hypothetical protein
MRHELFLYRCQCLKFDVTFVSAGLEFVGGDGWGSLPRRNPARTPYPCFSFVLFKHNGFGALGLCDAKASLESHKDEQDRWFNHAAA